MSKPDLDLDLGKASKSKEHTFTSPADRTVRKALPSAKTGAAAPRAQAAVAGNPDLAMELNAYGTSAHSVELDTAFISADATLEVTIDWGDKKTEVVSTKVQNALPETTTLTTKHTYAEVGSYTVKVTVKDVANNVVATNEIAHVAPGSDFTPYARPACWTPATGPARRRAWSSRTAPPA
ncbi:hypothetical protein WKI68_22485 [Streptomyces sp. MS1.HAVA.3]|uniref:PKD domain-containing protein n=1 Tax=Streptomyces caledonius TaxID=3134107 RepID=A0ABU8U7Z6_9ACTN